MRKREMHLPGKDKDQDDDRLTAVRNVRLNTSNSGAYGELHAFHQTDHHHPSQKFRVPSRFDLKL